MMKSSVEDEFGNEESRQAPGRPRSERLDQATRKAAVDLVLASGFRALSMDAIAAKAGVGRMTIYRRWPNKAAIIMDSFVARVDLGTLFSSASSFKKSIWLLMRTMAKSSQGKDGALIRVLLAEVSSIPNSPRLSGNDGPHREEEWRLNTSLKEYARALFAPTSTLM